MLDLTPLVAAFVLTTEGRTWLYQGVKEHAVREVLDVSLTRYYQLVNVLIDSPLGNELDPVTCRILRSKRDRLQRSRRIA